MAILFKVAPAIEEITFDDDFTGTNGDPLDPEKWEIWWANNGTVSIQDNKARYACVSGYDLYHKNIAETFPGDFDVQIDFSVVAGPNTKYWQCFLSAQTIDGPNSGWRYAIGRLRDLAQQLRYWQYTPSEAFATYVNSSTSGKFRLTRVNDHFKGWYNVGSGWVNDYDGWSDTSGTVQIIMGIGSGSSNPASTIDFDNLISV